MVYLVDKSIWTDEDFNEMGWHDSRLYSISLPNEKYKISFDIDYIFRWERDGDNISGFWVAPCLMEFYNVSEFRVQIPPKDNGGYNIIGFDISDVTRGEIQSTPNDAKVRRYKIEGEGGLIEFDAMGFVMTVKDAPVFSQNQSLGRE